MNYQTKQNNSEEILASFRSYGWRIVCPSKMSLDKATRQRSELLERSELSEQHSYSVVQETIGILFLFITYLKYEAVH